MDILVVDDHPLFVEGLRPTLLEIADHVRIRHACSFDRSVSLLDDGPIDLCLIDLTLPDRDGWDVLQACRARRPEATSVVMSASTRRANVRQALRLGAAGYICKDSSPALVLHALRLMLHGGVYVPVHVIREWQDVLTALPGEAPFADRARDLTGRQREVLDLLIDGRSNRDISNRLGCCESTVKAHVTAVLKALAVPNRTEAAREARKLGWIAASGVR